MKLIPLGRNGLYAAKVSDRDYQWLLQWKWHATRNGQHRRLYAIRRPRINGKRMNVWMHCEILGIPRGSSLRVDHRDLDGLNNQRRNIRKATKQQNAANTKTHARSGFKGVTQERTGRYAARIVVNYKTIYLGTRDTKEEAHRLYLCAARKAFGQFARAQ